MTNGRFLGAAALLALAGCASQQATQPVAASSLQAASPILLSAEAAMERVRTIDPQVKSVLTVDLTIFEQVKRIERSGVSGALVGKPILIKDNIEVANLEATTAGSLALVGNVTNRDAPIITRLRAAGMIILGKTNLSEW